MTNREGGKPLPGSQIMASHPLAHGLVFCFVFNEGAGERVYQSYPTLSSNVPNAQYYAMGGTPGPSWKTAITDIGFSPEHGHSGGIMPTAGNNIGANTTGAIGGFAGKLSMSQTTYTMAYCATPAIASQAGSYHGVFAFGDYNPAIYLKTTSAAWGMYYGGDKSFNTNLATRQHYHCLASVTGGVATGYTDGVKEATQPTGVNAPTNTLRIGSSGGAGGNATEGITQSIFVWNRALTAHEANQWALDPYQMFRPHNQWWMMAGVSGVTSMPCAAGIGIAAAITKALTAQQAAGVGINAAQTKSLTLPNFASAGVGINASMLKSITKDCNAGLGINAAIVKALTTQQAAGVGIDAVPTKNLTLPNFASAGIGINAAQTKNLTVEYEAGVGINAALLKNLTMALDAGLGINAAAILTIIGVTYMNVSAGIGIAADITKSLDVGYEAGVGISAEITKSLAVEYDIGIGINAGAVLSTATRIAASAGIGIGAAVSLSITKMLSAGVGVGAVMTKNLSPVPFDAGIGVNASLSKNLTKELAAGIGINAEIVKSLTMQIEAGVGIDAAIVKNLTKQVAAGLGILSEVDASVVGEVVTYLIACDLSMAILEVNMAAYDTMESIVDDGITEAVSPVGTYAGDWKDILYSNTYAVDDVDKKAGAYSIKVTYPSQNAFQSFQYEFDGTLDISEYEYLQVWFKVEGPEADSQIRGSNTYFGLWDEDGDWIKWYDPPEYLESYDSKEWVLLTFVLADFDIEYGTWDPTKLKKIWFVIGADGAGFTMTAHVDDLKFFNQDQELQVELAVLDDQSSTGLDTITESLTPTGSLAGEWSEKYGGSTSLDSGEAQVGTNAIKCTSGASDMSMRYTFTHVLDTSVYTHLRMRIKPSSVFFDNEPYFVLCLTNGTSEFSAEEHLWYLYVRLTDDDSWQTLYLDLADADLPNNNGTFDRTALMTLIVSYLGPPSSSGESLWVDDIEFYVESQAIEVDAAMGGT